MGRTFAVEIECKGMEYQRALELVRAKGIDIRYEGYNHTTRTWWKIVWDGTVQGGFEVVAPVLRGERGLEEIRKVAKALEDGGATIDSKCGLHVHFGADGLSVAAVKKIVERYAAYENEIDAFMPPSRRKSNNHLLKSMVGHVANSIINYPAAQLRTLANAPAGRYLKVNLKAIEKHGTIEFRHHGGTVNAEKIVNWVRFLAAFIEKSVELCGVAPASPRRSGQRMPRHGTKRLEIAEHVRSGKSAFEISNIMELVPTNVVYHVFCLERDYDVKFRKISLGEGDYRWEVERWFGEGATEEAPIRRTNGTDNGLFDGMTDDLIAFYRNRTARFARRAA